MPDTFTEKTSQSWFSRIAGSFAGALVGLIMMLVAFPLLWWNEGRAVRTAQGLMEGAGAVVSVAADNVDASRDGALVHVSGLATTTETLRDEVFGVAAPALTLVRSVEMFQWREEKKSEKRKRLGGSEETTTTYTYKTGWSRTAIDSAEFRQPDGHRNPGPLPWESTTIVADRVTLGAFTLPRDLVATIAARVPLRIDANGAAQAASAPGVRIVDGGFYRGANPENPAVGDVRIQYEVVKPQMVSVVAVQRGDSFEAFRTKAGTTILMLEEGTVAADAMFKAAESSNRVIAWVLRAVGLFLMFLGLFLLFRPLAVVGSVVPMIGSLVGGGIGFVAFFVALALSLGTISMAWLAYRPMLAIGLLVVAAAGILLAIRRQRAKRAAAGAAPPLPPAHTPRMTPPPLPPAS